MDIDTKPEYVWTPRGLNYAFFVVGLLIVVLSTHSWVATLGCLIASLHINVKVKSGVSSGESTKSSS